jgi:streptomycin 3"-adenylyltransferase
MSDGTALPAPVGEYGDVLLAVLRSSLGPRLAGVYLHGSAAMGGWLPALSDVDVLVVVSQPLSAEQKSRMATELMALPALGTGLELSVVRVPLQLSPKPPFELHVASAENKVVDGAGHEGDSDLVMHYAACWARGIALFGPPPAEIFPEVPRQLLLETLLQELEWGLEHAPARYAVLNAARAVGYAEDGDILSKVEGGQRAFAHFWDRETTSAALIQQYGGSANMDADRVRTFVERARAILSAELAQVEARP